MELFGLMQINRFFMQRGECCCKRNFADDFCLAGRVNHNEVIAGNGTQTHGVGRVTIGSPVRGTPGAVQKSGFREKGAQVSGIVRSELFIFAQGEFEDGAL